MRTWVSYYIPYKPMDVITNLCLIVSQSMSVKRPMQWYDCSDAHEPFAYFAVQTNTYNFQIQETSHCIIYDHRDKYKPNQYHRPPFVGKVPLWVPVTRIICKAVLPGSMAFTLNFRRGINWRYKNIKPCAAQSTTVTQWPRMLTHC